MSKEKNLVKAHTCVRVAPGGQMQLSRVRVEHVNVLVEEQLHELGRLQELSLAAENAGSLLGRVHHAATRQGENHHEGVLHEHTETHTRTCRETQAHERARSQTHTTAVNAQTLTHTPSREAEIHALLHVSAFTSETVCKYDGVLK